jgi:tRNA(adenine34) deaminase
MIFHSTLANLTNNYGLCIMNYELFSNFANMEQQQKDEKYMRKALDEAQKAYDEGEIPIGAIIVCQGHIIARAHNLTETLHDVTAHAEMQAITAAANELGGKYLTDCTLYVTVEPCIMCAGALGWSQIPRIVYGCRDEKRGHHDYAPHALHPKCNITGGMLEEECRQLMQDFFKQKR